MNALRREFEFTDDDFQFLVRTVHDKTGIVLAKHKRDMIYGRVARRIRALGFKSVGEYCSLLENDGSESEIMDFVNAVTTNLTKFFREPHHFAHLKKNVLVPLAQKPPSGKRVRIWSAGCSAGMEPYSIAMTAYDSIWSLDKWDFRILATDIDTNMLKVGKDGIYSEADIAEVPENYRKKFVLTANCDGLEQVIMAEHLKKLISFKRFNFIDRFWPMKGSFDVIFCRNVVIYFSKETQRIIFNKFADLLKPDGWLYIGHSESLNNITDRFILESKTIYRKAT